MSGRDLRMFITTHRAGDIERLCVRMKDGLGSDKYKPVHYEQLQALLQAKKLHSAHFEAKIQKTQQVAKTTREHTLLRQHRQVWTTEQDRLTAAGKQAESELQSFLLQSVDKDFSPQFLGYDLLLGTEREAFQEVTVAPVWQLKEDLHSCLAVMSSNPSIRDLMLQQVGFVKEQQEAIVEKLNHESTLLERQLSEMRIEELLSTAWEALEFAEPVPAEILHSECPYPDLKASLIHEFKSLSGKYTSRLQDIRQRLCDMDSLCGWPAGDHTVFQMTVSQYHSNLSQHRALYMDMLQRLLPHRSRQELADHERHWDLYSFTTSQQQQVIQRWRRDRADLLAKAMVTLEEAQIAHQEHLAIQSDRNQQQKICTKLREKLQAWRAQQEEMAQLEAAVAARRQEEEEERLRKEQEKEANRRARQKEKIREYCWEKLRRRQELEKQDQHRLDELRSLMKEQARKDWERILYRQTIVLQRREESEQRAWLKMKEEEEKQQRLESLRKQVAVQVEADPCRAMADTKASKSRHQAEEEEFVLQKPLYNLHTYTDAQIISDPRVRIEQALRDAGLHNTLYAKEIFSSILPPKPPRRDTESTVMKA